MGFIDITLDSETNNLLNQESIDYTASPFKLKDDFDMHCIVVEEHQSGDMIAFYNGDTYILDGREYQEEVEGVVYELKDYEPVEYIHKQLDEFPEYVKDNRIRKVVAHNMINFDLLVFKLWFGMDYEVEPDRWCGKKVVFEDTLVIAKTLNPDRFGGASLENLAKCAGKNLKSDFRKSIPQAVRFQHFAADMLHYNIFDVKSNTDVYHYLQAEKGDWDWEAAIRTEKAVAEIITRQEHRGFKFDKELAEQCVEELDALMEERRVKVEPLLPPRPATKKFLKDHTPPVNQLKTINHTLPKKPFKANGEFSATLLKSVAALGLEAVHTGPCEGYILLDGVKINIESGALIKTEYEVSSYMENFVNKHNGDIHPSKTKVRLYGKVYQLPMDLEPIKTEMVATIEDTTHIKEWLVGLGWEPSEYKDKDITVKSGPAKIKRTPEELEVAVDKYVEETFSSNLWKDRLEHFNVKNKSALLLRQKILQQASKRSCKVLTNPSFTVGQEKEIDPALLDIASSFPYVKDIVEYLTYRHRRNSILGGGLDWDEEEDAEKGYLASIREDGRIPTPADTCGAATSRFKHRLVTNIPRESSLYGGNMRALFGVDTQDFLQVGYDFSSLEAGIEAHYCWEYEEGTVKEYCKSLTQDKPNDVHTMMSVKISDLIDKDFSRGAAKGVKYGCLPVDTTTTLSRKGWVTYDELEVGEEVMTYNQEKDIYEWSPIEKLWYYKDAELTTMSNKWMSLESTADHRWYGYQRRMKGSKVGGSVRFNNPEVKTTEEINTEFNILHASYYSAEDSEIKPCEAALVAWILSDGYYKWSELSERTSSSKGKRKGITCSISQAVSKYYVEVEKVLEDNSMPYSKDSKTLDNGNVLFTYRLKPAAIREFLDRVVGCRKQKHDVDWVAWILKLDQESLQEFVHHFWLADGHKRPVTKVITQNVGNILDAVFLAANLTGHRVSSSYKTEKCMVVNLSPIRTTSGQRLIKSPSRVADVFCVTTKNNTFVVKQGNFITLTGNCTYGAQPAKVAKTIGSDLETGTSVFSAFWEAAKPLKLLKDALVQHWESNGKKFIRGLDGRKVPTRAEHAILNSLFQSAGVICAKYTMIVHDRLLKKEGLAIDFFKDDWKSSKFCQQLIAYHK